MAPIVLTSSDAGASEVASEQRKHVCLAVLFAAVFLVTFVWQMLPALGDGKRDLKSAEVMSARFAPPLQPAEASPAAYSVV
jgi:hypothetical protein